MHTGERTSGSPKDVGGTGRAVPILAAWMVAASLLAGCLAGGSGGAPVSAPPEPAPPPSLAPATSLSPPPSSNRFVPFVSAASNLVAGDTNGVMDVFVHDRETGRTVRVSVASDGTQGDGESFDPCASWDGRYVAFTSHARNLVAGDTNRLGDVFVHDRQTGRTTRVSVASGGTQGDYWSQSPSLSGDGRSLVFSSHATNLVAGDTNETDDIFVHDLQSGDTRRVSLAPDGRQADGESTQPCLSGDGRCVAFNSYATNLVAGDTNGTADVFVYDLQGRQTTRVSVATAGAQASDGVSYGASLSGDGRCVAFVSTAVELDGGRSSNPEAFVHDRQTGQTTRVTVPYGRPGELTVVPFPSISLDGRRVAFSSGNPSLVPGDTNGKEDVFLHDGETGRTLRVSLSSNGAQGNGDASDCRISPDGSLVIFNSTSSNLVPGDTNGSRDVFVRDLRTNQTTRISVGTKGEQGNGPSGVIKSVE